MECYEIIRELRKEQGLTQAEVAKILDTSQQYYGQYELGKRPLSIKHLKILCQYYGVSADYILGLSEKP